MTKGLPPTASTIAKHFAHRVAVAIAHIEGHGAPVGAQIIERS